MLENIVEYQGHLKVLHVAEKVLT